MFKRKYAFLTRRKISFFVIPSLIVSLIFIMYQLTIFWQLSSETKMVKSKSSLIRGIHKQEETFYLPDGNKFTCIKSMEIIDFNRVNDDYCDCLDGSDEPGTNACANGIFYCSEHSANKKYPKLISSAKVNDGICDCCDGSDEWSHNQVLKSFDRTLQRKYNKFLVPCPKSC